MKNETKQTAVELLFLEFKSLSKVSRDAGDEQTANLIDFLCEREQQAKEMEKERMIEFAQLYAVIHCMGDITKNADEYYTETYGGNK